MPDSPSPATQTRDIQTYREVLYQDYSSHFGSAKNRTVEGEARMFDHVYADLRIPTNAVVGDIGCGRGEWLLWVRESREVKGLVGFDYSAAELEALQGKEIETHCGDALDLLRKHPERFDLLHSKDLIEHLTKDEVVDFLRTCLAALKPGGSLVLSTYNALAPFSNVIANGDFTHETGFSPTSMAQVLRACGFQIEKVTTILPASTSVSGKCRRIVWKFYAALARLGIQAYGGKSVASPEIDRHGVNPGLLAYARKPVQV